MIPVPVPHRRGDLVVDTDLEPASVKLVAPPFEMAAGVGVRDCH